MSRQAERFIRIGSIATTVHILTASLINWILINEPYFSNTCGYLVATIVSYLGHTQVTFSVRPRHRFHFPRFLVVSLSGLLISSFITWWGVVHYGLPFIVTMLIVALFVPAITFYAFKLWALKE